MSEMNLTLPYPISANRYWRNYRGTVVVSNEAQQYRNLVWGTCREEKCEALSGPVELIVHAYAPQTNADLGNCEKVLSDALQGCCYTNDVQLHHIELFRHEATKPKRKNAKVVVTVRAYRG